MKKILVVLSFILLAGCEEKYPTQKSFVTEKSEWIKSNSILGNDILVTRFKDIETGKRYLHIRDGEYSQTIEIKEEK